MNAPAKGSKRRPASVLFLGVWILKLIFGLIDVNARHVPSYQDAVRVSPDLGQLELYVVIPSVFVVLNLLVFAFARKVPEYVVLVFSVLQILILVILLFFGAGGV
jgi:hypothetical protein